ncbi:MAG: hypothetical protein GVY26_16260 [Bacteroidetes bacterium]|jgi:type IV secretory pathway VirB10-like protein|nr:hypothetical protein [Bacteroidota bacterium]
MHYVFLARILGSLLAAYLLVRRLRAPIRSLIVRAMPLKVRMSEKAFALQARLSNIAGLTIWLLFAALLFWGSGQLQSLWDSPDNEKMEIMPSPPSKPVHKKAPEAPAEEKEPVTTTENNQPPPPRAEDPPKPATTPAYAPVAKPHFLQLGAYRSLQHARRSQARYAAKLQQAVWIAHAPGAGTPYKVLAGPFSSRYEAVQYQKNYALRGFPRPLEEMMLYQQ